MKNKNEKLGVLIPGMGAVASTFICGVIACNKGLSKPIGSMTQLGSIRLGKRTEDRSPIIKDCVSVCDMENLVFGGWDINDENVYEISIRSEVLDKTLLDKLKPELESINVETSKTYSRDSYAKPDATLTHIESSLKISSLSIEYPSFSLIMYLSPRQEPSGSLFPKYIELINLILFFL